MTQSFSSGGAETRLGIIFLEERQNWNDKTKRITVTWDSPLCERPYGNRAPTAERRRRFVFPQQSESTPIAFDVRMTIKAHGISIIPNPRSGLCETACFAQIVAVQLSAEGCQALPDLVAFNGRLVESRLCVQLTPCQCGFDRCPSDCQFAAIELSS